jgi:hypothetical protein
MSVADSSRQQLQRISLTRRKSMTDEIELTLRLGHQRGLVDMSMQEIQHDLEQRLERRIELSTISARVNELVTARRVVRDKENTRPCTRSKADIHPLSIPPTQARLCN